MSAALLPITTAMEARLAGTPLVVMLDVDGTLAPIAPRPEDAAVSPATRAVVERLVAADGVRVVLVSGRAAHDALGIVAVAGVWTIGNHGFEIVTPEGEVETDAELVSESASIAQAARDLEPIVAAVPGALLENKRWTLSIHYRLAARAAIAPLRDQVAQVALALRLRVTDGKEVVEVRPAARVDKGTAVVTMGERLHGFGSGASILFAGDDRTDEDAFRSLRARSPRAVTIRVAEPDVDTAAELTLRDPAAVQTFLEWLAARRA
jgi:trehalose 6-phosphate phosphatase